GMAYGIDKLYDNYEATNPYLWDLGITSGSDTGLAGKSDLPEVINYSAGIYQDDVDLDPAWNYFDALESRFGILNTVSAGNCGVQTPSIDGCNDGQHRVSTPGTNYNVMTTGGLDVTADPTNIATYAPWPNTSPGPTWGGRKKPDLVAPVFGTAGTPSAMDDTSWTSFGYGTSFAAPVAAGGALLLASSGVYLPTAQKAIMINSATPVQGQTYWTPRTGWGALNMTNAYYARGNYANGTVTGSGANSARFFELTGVAVDDRATLVWNRRTTTDSTLDPDYYDLTDLDLSQFDPGTLDPTSTGGSDASDPVDTDQTITADNPMPSEGNDGGDNIEQIRSTGTGSQILKVKSQSPVDGATSEPFSVAAANAPVALQTPIPEVTVTTLPTTTGLTQDFTVTATVENPSADLALDSPSVELTLPAGTTTLISGDNPQAIPTLAPSGTGVATWTVQATTAGTKTLTAAATGTAYGESFSGTGSAQINVDSTPPTATIAAPPTYGPTLSPTFTWSATDSQSTVASYDVEAAVDQGGWVSQLIDTTDTSISLTATEGQLVRLRVRATDSLDNTSDWSEVSTTLDSLPPVVLFGAVDASVRGTLQVPVIIFNAGSPTTSNFTFSDTVGGRTGSVTNGAVLQYKNTTSRTVLANLRVTATDALGRAVTTTAVYPVPPRVAPSNMRLIRLSRVGRFVKLTGSTAKGYNGKITFAATRIGKKGTRRARRTVPVKNGRFSIRLRVAAGRYKFSVSATSTSRYSGAALSKKLTVK
ncbi:MAG: S8 family serine peptidase, partial [Solirubrobacterales bacterium]